MNSAKRFIKGIPVVGKLAVRIYLFVRKRTFPGTAAYWEGRYHTGGDSGAGSYSKLAEFKAGIINAFVKEKNISSVLEFGCGDGNQLTFATYPSYIGLDVSPMAIKLCLDKFRNDSSKSFYLYNSYAFADNHELFRADLALSLDVIYHLVEEDLFANYMHHLFNASERYVIIYSSNYENKQEFHVKNRTFTAWVAQHKKDWMLLEKIGNKYKYDPKDPINTSIADFYIYQKARPK
jgi:hypothetical protein